MVNPDSAPHKLQKASAVYSLAYVAALIVAVAVGYVFRTMHPILVVLIADIAATLVIYAFGRVFHNASFYDAYWSIAPLVIVIYWVLRVSSDNPVSTRHIVLITLVFAWGLRLTINWARQWRGLKHEDWRYQDYRKKTKNWFWLVDLVGIELMPTVIVFLACLPLYPALTSGNTSFGIIDVIAIFVTAGAIFIETIADEQLRKFVLQRPRVGETLSAGLWAYSRHPNYLGEIMFWWGLYIFGLAADSGYWWTIIGPIAVTVLFTFVSIPLMEKRSLARRQGYDAHRKRISVLIPWFPKT